MENQIGLETKELESIFAQIKKTNNNDFGGEIYTAYLPLVDIYAKKYHLKEEQVQDIYTEVFCYLLDSAVKGVVGADNFDKCFNNIMTNKCYKIKKQQSLFNSELLSISYAKNVASREDEEEIKEEKKQFVTQSLLFVIQYLDQLKENPELAAQHGLSDIKISMIKDFYGLNKEKVRYSVAQIAEKYQINEKRAQAMLVSALKSIRDVEEFQPIKSHLK